MKADAAKRFADAKKCTSCTPPANRYGTNTPDTGGQWKKGEKGNGEWHPDPNTKKGKDVLKVTGIAARKMLTFWQY